MNITTLAIPSYVKYCNKIPGISPMNQKDGKFQCKYLKNIQPVF